MNLNKEQQEAVNSNYRTILCLAGAGAGKTQSLTQRINRLVQEGVDPSSILVLTFTNAAAFEMKDRYLKIARDAKKCPEFRTFHSFCYHIVIIDSLVRSRLGYSSIPKVCEPSEMKRIKSKAKLQIGTKLSDDELEGRKPVSNRYRNEVDLYHKAIKLILIQDNLITFDMLANDVASLFIQKDPIIIPYINKYKHILVDEFQDTDPDQVKFLNSFGDDTNFFLVADALQNIYAFRGTSNEFVKTFSRDPNWKVVKLNQNYRSTREICNFANKFSKTYSEDSYRIEMNGQRDGDKVSIFYGSSTNYVDCVDSQHCNILLSELSYLQGTCAILCRSNREVKYIADQLKSSGIMFNASDNDQTTLHLIKSAKDNKYMMDWLSTFLTAEEYSNYLRMCESWEGFDLRKFLGYYSDVKEIKKYSKKVNEIRHVFAEIIDTELRIKKLNEILKLNVDAPQETMNPESLLEYIAEHMSANPECSVYLGTIHSSKGLEYDTVFVMGVDDYMFRLDSEEMKNLYYVAITRAKNKLYVFRR